MIKKEAVLCPVCKQCNNHILQVKVLKKSDNTAVVIKYECEHGHYWSEGIHTHKGDCIKDIIIEERGQK